MLHGVRILELKRNIDERGSFTEVLREDWTEFLGSERPVQANYSVSQPGMIRAWHRHERGQFDIFVVVRGTLKICAYNDLGDPQNGELDEVVTSGDRLQAVIGPGTLLARHEVCEPRTLRDNLFCDPPLRPEVAGRAAARLGRFGHRSGLDQRQRP